MEVDWVRRPPDAGSPIYEPNSQYFTIKMFHTFGEVQAYDGRKLTGHIDFCCHDKMSRLELSHMAKELGLEAEVCSFWWLNLNIGGFGRLTEIKNDADALELAKGIDHKRVINVYAKLSNVGACDMEKEDNVIGEEGIQGSEMDVGSGGQQEHGDDASELMDSEYQFSSEEEIEAAGSEDVMGPDAVEEECAEGNEDALNAAGAESTEDESEYGNSEGFHSESESDAEGLSQGKPRYAEFHEEVDMQDPQFQIGMKFSSFNQFRDAVRNYAIKNRYKINFRPSNKKRCKAICKKGCPFYLWAAPMIKDQSTVQIKSGILKHECTRDHCGRHVSAKWLAHHYLDQFRADPSWSVGGLIQAVKQNQQVEINRCKAWRAKCIANNILECDEGEQVRSLYDYRLELLRTHPGSTIMFKCSEGRFEGMYVCLSSLKAGFLAGCRPIISVDGCWLQGLFGGQLLTAVGIDANDCIYPIAWAVVEKENYENWAWFLELLSVDLELNNSQHYAFISDRQKGLIPALQHLFPDSEHRYCVRHIHGNFRSNYKGKALKDQLWRCARASYIPAFNRAMETLKIMSPEAYEFLKKIPPAHWSKAHFKTHFKCDMLLNNLCECFNSFILGARSKGVVTLNETIRTKLMCRIQKKRDAMKKCKTVFCPRVLKKLEKEKTLSFSYNTTWSGGAQYQVVGSDGQFIIDKNNKTCSCRRWQLTGVPCAHAISAIYYDQDKLENYIDDCYRVSTFLQIYSHILYPTQGKDCWPKSDQCPMIPPHPVNRRRGRRTTMRRKDATEMIGFTRGKVSRKGTSNKCSTCGATGHNKRFHGLQAGRHSGSPQVQGNVTDPSGTTNETEVNATNPMDEIDPQLLEEHMQMVDNFIETQRSVIENEGPQQIPVQPVESISQVINSVDKDPHSASIGSTHLTKRPKLQTRGGKTNPQNALEKMPQAQNTRSRKNATTSEAGTQKRKGWVPPGAGGVSGAGKAPSR